MRRIGVMCVGLVSTLCVGTALWFGGCATSRQQSLLPAVMTEKVPSATPAGSDSCVDCHDDPPAFYQKSYHKLAFFQEGFGGAKVPGAVGVGCESCHGNGSVHVENGDYDNDLVGSEDLAAMSVSERSALCQTCHQDDFPLWQTTDHARSQVGCWDCHPGDLHSHDVAQPVAALFAAAGEGMSGAVVVVVVVFERADVNQPLGGQFEPHHEHAETLDAGDDGVHLLPDFLAHQ